MPTGPGDSPLRVWLASDWFVKYTAGLAAGLLDNGAEVTYLTRDHDQEFGDEPGAMRAFLAAETGGGSATSSSAAASAASPGRARSAPSPAPAAPGSRTSSTCRTRSPTTPGWRWPRGSRDGGATR